ncbi:PAS domain-containing protein [Aureococcus anophagefferens]|nr:PAS domain-containing protein [Aureococcus anophagefferens]
MTEQQKDERRERNREHAKRSRVRKKFLLESLQQSANALQYENDKLRVAIRDKMGDAVANELLARCGSDGRRRAPHGPRAAKIRKAVDEGYDTSVCLLNYRIDGSTFFNQFFVALRDGQGNAVNYAGAQCQKERAIQDLHERLHKAEARLPGGYDPRASNARRDAAADDDDDDSDDDDDDDDDDAVAAPAAPPKRAAAAGGWTRLTDSTSGDPYWWNRATNEAVFKAFIDTARLEARYEGHLAVFVHPDCVAFRDPRRFRLAAAAELVRSRRGAGTSGPTYCDRHPAWGGGASPRPSLMRYAHYAQYLANHAGEFDVVLWSDFRDAVFQRNPFEDWVDDSMGKDLVFFAEHPGKPITAAGHTRSWVTAAAARDFPACVETGGIDQGHHNDIVYATLATAGDLAQIAATAPLSKPAVAGTFVITPYDRGPVYTAGRVGSHFLSDLKRDADGYVLRSDGKRAALLHQYDRCVELLPFYANLQTRLNAAEVARGGVGADA